MANELTEQMKSLFAGKTWKMQMHLNGEKCGILQHRCDELKITKVVRTPKVKGHWGVGIVTYFRDDDENEYESLFDLATALLKHEVPSASEPT